MPRICAVALWVIQVVMGASLWAGGVVVSRLNNIMPDHVVSYSNLDAPEVEVLHEGSWCFGTLHEWRQNQESGRWTGWARYNTGPGMNRIGSFDQEHLRPFQVAHGPEEQTGRPPATFLPRVREKVASLTGVPAPAVVER